MTKKELTSKQLSKVALMASRNAIRENRALGLVSVFLNNGKLVKAGAGAKFSKTGSSKRILHKIKSKTLKIA